MSDFHGEQKEGNGRIGTDISPHTLYAVASGDPGNKYGLRTDATNFFQEEAALELLEDDTIYKIVSSKSTNTSPLELIQVLHDSKNGKFDFPQESLQKAVLCLSELPEESFNLNPGVAGAPRFEAKVDRDTSLHVTFDDSRVATRWIGERQRNIGNMARAIGRKLVFTTSGGSNSNSLFCSYEPNIEGTIISRNGRYFAKNGDKMFYIPESSQGNAANYIGKSVVFDVANTDVSKSGLAVEIRDKSVYDREIQELRSRKAQALSKSRNFLTMSKVYNLHRESIIGQITSSDDILHWHPSDASLGDVNIIQTTVRESSPRFSWENGFGSQRHVDLVLDYNGTQERVTVTDPRLDNYSWNDIHFLSASPISKTLIEVQIQLPYGSTQTEKIGGSFFANGKSTYTIATPAGQVECHIPETSAEAANYFCEDMTSPLDPKNREKPNEEQVENGLHAFHDNTDEVLKVLKEGFGFKILSPEETHTDRPAIVFTDATGTILPYISSQNDFDEPIPLTADGKMIDMDLRRGYVHITDRMSYNAGSALLTALLHTKIDDLSTVSTEDLQRLLREKLVGIARLNAINEVTENFVYSQSLDKAKALDDYYQNLMQSENGKSLQGQPISYEGKLLILRMTQDSSASPNLPVGILDRPQIHTTGFWDGDKTVSYFVPLDPEVLQSRTPEINWSENRFNKHNLHGDFDDNLRKDPSGNYIYRQYDSRTRSHTPIPVTVLDWEEHAKPIYRNFLRNLYVDEDRIARLTDLIISGDTEVQSREENPQQVVQQEIASPDELPDVNPVMEVQIDKEPKAELKPITFQPDAEVGKAINTLSKSIYRTDPGSIEKVAAVMNEYTSEQLYHELQGLHNSTLGDTSRNMNRESWRKLASELFKRYLQTETDGLFDTDIERDAFIQDLIDANIKPDGMTQSWEELNANYQKAVLTL